jgi:DNA replication protein DnaC
MRLYHNGKLVSIQEGRTGSKTSHTFQIDDFGLQRLSPLEAQDLYEVMIERYGISSTIMTSSRHVDEGWASSTIPFLPTRSLTASRTMRT